MLCAELYLKLMQSKVDLGEVEIVYIIIKISIFIMRTRKRYSRKHSRNHRHKRTHGHTRKRTHRRTHRRKYKHTDKYNRKHKLFSEPEKLVNKKVTIIEQVNASIVPGLKQALSRSKGI